MRIMQMTEEKKKIRKEAAAENKPDSTAILRNMMTMMKAKGVGLPDEERVEKETDMAKISNARDIFKQREAIEQDGEEAPKPRAEKQKRVDVCVGFLNDNKNKAEEMRQARLREWVCLTRSGWRRRRTWPRSAMQETSSSKGRQLSRMGRRRRNQGLRSRSELTFALDSSTTTRTRPRRCDKRG